MSNEDRLSRLLSPIKRTIFDSTFTERVLDRVEMGGVEMLEGDIIDQVAVDRVGWPRSQLSRNSPVMFEYVVPAVRDWFLGAALACIGMLCIVPGLDRVGVQAVLELSGGSVARSGQAEPNVLDDSSLAARSVTVRSDLASFMIDDEAQQAASGDELFDYSLMVGDFINDISVE